jgi:gamma-glutamylcyclotransferase
MDKKDRDSWCKKKGYKNITFINGTTARIEDYRLDFNYYSSGRNGGAANIMHSTGSSVYGLLVEINDEDLSKIREKEGFFGARNDRNYYDEIEVSVKKIDGNLVGGVKTYKVAPQREEREYNPPSKEYLNLIINSAKKYGFPASYIDFLENFEIQR